MPEHVDITLRNDSLWMTHTRADTTTAVHGDYPHWHRGKVCQERSDREGTFTDCLQTPFHIPLCHSGSRAVEEVGMKEFTYLCFSMKATGKGSHCLNLWPQFLPSYFHPLVQEGEWESCWVGIWCWSVVTHHMLKWWSNSFEYQQGFFPLKCAEFFDWWVVNILWLLILH